MKKKLLAAAVVGALASPVAFAQTLYGIVDVGYQNLKHTNAGNFNKHFVQSGQHSGSRLGVRGSEDLAGGTYAMYQVEFNIVADTGGPGATDTTRLTFVGLGSKAWGELTFGRQYTHTFHTFAVGSASGYGTFSSFYVGGLGPVTGTTTRASNSVKYSSPVMGGFSVGVLLAPGESAVAGASSAGNYMDAAIRYTPGPFGVALSWAQATAQAPGGPDNDTTELQLTANWDNRAFGIYGGYKQIEDDGVGAGSTVDRSAWWLNAVARFGGRHELYFLYGVGENDLVSGNESTTIAITYQHVMSKRTRIYTSIGRVTNDVGAGGGLATSLAGQAVASTGDNDPRGFQLGMVHTF